MSANNAQPAGGTSAAATSKLASECQSVLDDIHTTLQRELGVHASARLTEGVRRCKEFVSQMLFEADTGNSSAAVKRLESECRRLTDELNDCRANLVQDEEIFREKIKELKDAKKQNHSLRKELQTFRDNLPAPFENGGLLPEQEQRLKELRSELYSKELQIKIGKTECREREGQ